MSVSLRLSQKLATTRLISIVAPPTPFIYVAQPCVRLHPGQTTTLTVANRANCTQIKLCIVLKSHTYPSNTLPSHPHSEHRLPPTMLLTQSQVSIFFSAVTSMSSPIHTQTPSNTLQSSSLLSPSFYRDMSSNRKPSPTSAPPFAPPTPPSPPTHTSTLPPRMMRLHLSHTSLPATQAQSK